MASRTPIFPVRAGNYHEQRLEAAVPYPSAPPRDGSCTPPGSSIPVSVCGVGGLPNRQMTSSPNHYSSTERPRTRCPKATAPPAVHLVAFQAEDAPQKQAPTSSSPTGLLGEPAARVPAPAASARGYPGPLTSRPAVPAGGRYPACAGQLQPAHVRHVDVHNNIEFLVLQSLPCFQRVGHTDHVPHAALGVQHTQSASQHACSSSTEYDASFHFRITFARRPLGQRGNRSINVVPHPISVSYDNVPPCCPSVRTGRDRQSLPGAASNFLGGKKWIKHLSAVFVWIPSPCRTPALRPTLHQHAW